MLFVKFSLDVLIYTRVRLCCLRVNNTITPTKCQIINVKKKNADIKKTVFATNETVFIGLKTIRLKRSAFRAEVYGKTKAFSFPIR